MQHRLTIGFLALFALLRSPIYPADKMPAPPPTRIEEVADTLHGTKVADPYRWLEDASSADVKEWTAKQNAYAHRILDKLPGRDKIHDRLGTLLEIGSLGTPIPAGGRWFFTKREGKQNQPILYVRSGEKGDDRVLVDPNKLSADGTTALDWWFPSRDGNMLAYGLSKDGNERSVLHVVDVPTGKVDPIVIDRCRACSVAWLPNSNAFFYTRYPAPGSVPKDEENYHRRVYFHLLGNEPEKDVEIFGKGRAKEDWPTLSLSPDGRWLIVTVQQGWAKSEVYFSDRGTADGLFVPLVEKVPAVFHATARDDRFLIHTNDGAPRYRLYQIDPVKPKRADWKELVAEGSDVLEGAAAIGKHLVLQYMHKAAARLKICDTDGKPVRDVPLATLGSIAGLGGEWNGHDLYFGFQSFTEAPSVYHLDLTPATGEHKLPDVWGQVKTDIDFAAYEVEQVTYPSKDKTPVTMFLAHKKGIKKDGTNPTLLYGYGGFNISITPTFNASRFLFLERGGVLAIANLRGGGEYGEDWHRAGMLGNKQNVFDDFIGAAEYLIANKYTAPQRLAIQGGSNGGLLVGAALTQRPELFRAVVCQVPLLDMVRYHKFLIARLWIPEYGSAEDAEQFKSLYSYSPYHHVKPGTASPAVLLTAAESDTRRRCPPCS